MKLDNNMRRILAGEAHGKKDPRIPKWLVRVMEWTDWTYALLRGPIRALRLRDITLEKSHNQQSSRERCLASSLLRSVL